jgi:hypothetical protein
MLRSPPSCLFQKQLRVEEDAHKHHSPPNTFLFTADAVSMYTNTPTAKALSFISNHIREIAHEFQDIPTEALVEALGIVMRNNVFTFGDVTYKQVRGTAMGTPPAPIWTNLYMSINEDTFLQPLDTNHSTKGLLTTCWACGQSPTQPLMPPHGQHSVFN